MASRPISVADGGTASVATRGELASLPAWSRAFADQRKDRRYFELVDDTLPGQGFDFQYLVLRDGNDDVRAIQPFFLLDQDITAGAGRFIQSLMKRARSIWPRLLKMRTMMVGCAAGEGHLDGENTPSPDWVGRSLAAAIPELARQFKAKLVVMKEFPSGYRTALRNLCQVGFTRVPSLPMVRLDIDYASFDDYVVRKLTKPTRKNLRRKLRRSDSAEPRLELEVTNDVTPFVDEIYPLYLAVFERSSLHFEKLTKEFLSELGRRMPDKTRFFIWRQAGKAVAFSLCMINRDTIYDEYLGLDYGVALDLHLYFYTLRDIINWAIAHELKWYVSSALNYEPKLHLRCDLAPLDLYVAHTSPLINAFMKRILPWLEPTRSDPVLRRFANFGDLWGDRAK